MHTAHEIGMQAEQINAEQINKKKRIQKTWSKVKMPKY